MKFALIFSLFTLIVMVRGNIIAVAQPVLLALGTIFAAVKNQDAHEIQPLDWKNLMPFVKNESCGIGKEKQLSPEEITEK